MTLEFFIKIIYLFSAIIITIFSLSIIGQNFLLFLLILIFDNIIARLIADSSILFLMMYKRVNEIKESLKPNKPVEKDKTKKINNLHCLFFCNHIRLIPLSRHTKPRRNNSQFNTLFMQCTKSIFMILFYI